MPELSKKGKHSHKTAAKFRDGLGRLQNFGKIGWAVPGLCKKDSQSHLNQLNGSGNDRNGDGIAAKRPGTSRRDDEIPWSGKKKTESRENATS